MGYPASGWAAVMLVWLLHLRLPPGDDGFIRGELRR
jgi:hypothetical protein